MREADPPPLPYGKSWRVRSKPQVRNCKSQICRSLTPLKSPPSAPAHSARPPQNMRGPGFCDFQKTLAVAERAANKLLTIDCDPYMTFSKLCFPPSLRSTISIFNNFQNFIAKMQIKHVAFKKVLPALGGEHNFDFHEFSFYRNHNAHRFCHFQKCASRPRWGAHF